MPLVLSVPVAAVLAFCAARRGWRSGLVAATVLAFFCGGAWLAVQAWQGAWRSSLRVAFESIAREQRRQAERADSDHVAEDMASVALAGVLRTDAGPSAGGVGLDIDVAWVGRSGQSRLPHGGAANPVRGRVLLTVPGEIAFARAGQWRAGRRVEVVAQLKRPARYLDPGIPDQERALVRRGVALVGSVKSGALVEVVAEGSRVAEWAASARAFARSAIADAVGRWSRQSAAIVSAIVIGDRTGLDPAVESRLQQAGTYHVIAISGGNIAILAGLILILFRLAGFLGRAAMLTAAAALIAYGDVVNGGVSVDRATMMAGIYFLGRSLDLRGPPLNALLVVAGVLAFMDPLVVADPGFLLTFGATTAILALAAMVDLRLPRLFRPAAALFLASLAAEAALFPVSAAFFSRVTVAGLALNFAAIPLMAIAQLAGMGVVLSVAASPLVAHALGLVAHLGAAGLVASSALVNVAPVATWRVVTPSGYAVASYYGAGVAALYLWHRRRAVAGSGESTATRRIRRVSAAAAAAAGIWIVWPPGAGGSSGDGRLHVAFLDVGQGDAALVTFPHGSTMLIDTGGLPGAGFDVGDRVVAPQLRRGGVWRLDVLALTHGDRDHVGGAPSIVREFRPRDVWQGVPVPRADPLRRLNDATERMSHQWSMQRGDAVSIEGVRIVVHHPGAPDWERQAVRNEDSLILELRWRDVSFVFTGDAGLEAESGLQSAFAPSPIRVVKVPHHGSATSSTEPFVRALAPTVAVISVGRGNSYGHPSRTVVDRYRAAGAAIYRTDRDGAVTVTTNGSTLDVATFIGGSATFQSDAPRKHESTKAF